jgi:hypothetical protein
MGDEAVAEAFGDRGQAQPGRRDACPMCGGLLSVGEPVELRHGGTEGGWKLLFGEWAELGEGKLPTILRVCRDCGYLAFFLDRR